MSMREIDFTNCKKMFKVYSGANGQKLSIEYDGEQYMLKFPPSAAGKPTELSYTNGCVSEHIGSTIFRMIGIPAQETMLGTFTANGKTKVVCACRDFVQRGKCLYDFCGIKNTIIDSEHHGTGTELSSVLETIQKQEFVESQKLLSHFWNVFVVDAFLGNFDRHNGNWGFLFDEESHRAEIAPVFDCGSCLLPQADENIMNDVLCNEDKLNARIFHFPASALRENDKKIGYYDFLTSAKNPDCNEAVLRIVPRIDMDRIIDFVNNEVPYITELQKQFYTRYIEARYEKIMIPAYEAVLALNEQAAGQDEDPGITMGM